MKNTLDTSAGHTSAFRVAAAAVAATLVAAFAAPAAAQVLEQRPQEDITGRTSAPRIDDADVVPSEYSVDVGVTFTTDYYFRGYVQSTDGLFNGGLISQPYLEVGIPLFANERFAVNANIGTWNSFHSENPSAGLGPRTWFESDLYGGVTATTGDFEFGAIYTFYLSPAGTFSEIQEVGAFVAYDVPLFRGTDEADRDLALALGIGAGIYYETKSEADKRMYLELGVQPSTKLEIGNFAEPLTLAFPVAVGISLDDYFAATDADGNFVDDDTVGFVSVAAALTIPLTPGGRYGTLSVTPAVQGLFLVSDNLEALNDGSDTEIIGSLTFDLSF